MTTPVPPDADLAAIAREAVGAYRRFLRAKNRTASHGARRNLLWQVRRAGAALDQAMHRLESQLAEPVVTAVTAEQRRRAQHGGMR